MDSWTDEDGTAHEWCRILYFLGKDFIGEEFYDPGSHPDLGYRRGGTLYICRGCGDIWARLLVINSKDKQETFAEICDVACERHRDPWSLAGSLLSGYRNSALLPLLPLALLEREFRLHLRELER